MSALIIKVVASRILPSPPRFSRASRCATEGGGVGEGFRKTCRKWETWASYASELVRGGETKRRVNEFRTMNVGDENFYRIKAIPLSFYPFLSFSPRERGPGMLIKFREIVEKIYEKEKKKGKKTEENRL